MTATKKDETPVKKVAFASDKKSRKQTKPRAQSDWTIHVASYRAEHNVSFKEALQKAGDTYVKIERVKKDKKDYKKNPWMVFIGEWIKDHPDWRATHSYKEVLQLCKGLYSSSKNTLETAPDS